MRVNRFKSTEVSKLLEKFGFAVNILTHNRERWNLEPETSVLGRFSTIAISLGFAFSLSLVDGFSRPANAACLRGDGVQTNTGTTGPDTLQCDDTYQPGGGTVRGNGGDDTITLSGAGTTTAQRIRGDAGEDDIQISGGTVTNDVFLGSTSVNSTNDDDEFTITGGSVGRDVRGDAGADTIDLFGGSVGRNVRGHRGNDVITLGDISGGTTVTGNITGDDGNDEIYLLNGSANRALGGNGTDTIFLNGATITSDIRGNSGADEIDLLSGTAGQVRGDGGNDTITLNGATVNGNLRGGSGADIIDLFDGEANQVRGDGGNDVITLEGATINTNIRGNGGNDTIDLFDGEVNQVRGDNGNDTITLDGDVTVNTSIRGNDGNDTIDLFKGTADFVRGEDDDDTITVDGATINLDVRGDSGADNISMSSGEVKRHVFLGLGNLSTTDADSFTMTGGDIGGSVLGDAGVDTFELNGGTVAVNVRGEAGADEITLNGTTISGDMLGGDGADTIDLLDGSVNLVSGDEGADKITLNGATVATSLSGGDGDDEIEFLSGSVDLIDGGDGSDTLFVSGSAYDGTQTLDGGDDLSDADGFIDRLTFSGVSAMVGGGDLLKNWEVVTLDGAEMSFSDGALTVGDDAGAGLFLINGAMLNAGGGFALTGNLTNNAILSSRDGVAGDVISVSGDYSGSGVIEIDVDFATDMADTLMIAGDVAGGASAISVDDISTGAASGNDIVVVDVAGATAEGDFALQGGGSITSGALVYDFELVGSQWILTQASLTGDAALYSSASAILLDASRPSTFAQRIWLRSGPRGSSQQTGDNAPRVYSQNPSTFSDRPEDRSGPWIRIYGDRLKEELSGTTDISLESTVGGFQVGGDFVAHSGESGQAILGFNGSIHTIDATTGSSGGDGSIDGDGFGLGATATWYSGDGTYADFQAEMGWLYSDLGSSTSGLLANSVDSNSYMLSGEVGRRIGVGGGSFLTPQVQLWMAVVETESFTDSQGNSVNFDTAEDVVGRLGLAYEYENFDHAGSGRENFYVVGSVLHNFDGESSARVSGQNLTVSGEDTWAEIAAGGLLTLGESTHVFAEGAYRTAIDGDPSENYGLSLTAGVRVQW